MNNMFCVHKYKEKLQSTMSGIFYHYDELGKGKVTLASARQFYIEQQTEHFFKKNTQVKQNKNGMKVKAS